MQRSGICSHCLEKQIQTIWSCTRETIAGFKVRTFFFLPLDKYLLLQDDKQTAKVAAVQEAKLTSSCQMIAVQAREHGTDKNAAREAM